MIRKHLFLSAALLFLGMLISYITATSCMQVKVHTFKHIATNGAVITGKMYIPASADAANPVPAVLTCAGGNNEYIRHENINTELASRGYAVITFNPFKHGDSSVFVSRDMGATEMLNYVWDLDFVDRNNIALEGHTMGGAYLTLATIAQPEKVRSLIILDAISIRRSLSDINQSFPVNITWIVSKYNEHLRDPSRMFAFRELVTACGVPGPVEAGRIYGSTKNKNSRAIFLTRSTVNTHGFSMDTIGQVVTALQRTTQSPVQRSAGIQIWPLLLFGKLLSFIGLISLMFSLIQLLIPNAAASQVSLPEKTTGIHLWKFLSAPLLMGAAFIPIYTMGKRALNPSPIFPQTDSNGLAILAVVGTCIYWVLGQRLNRRDPFAPDMQSLLAIEFRAIGKLFLTALSIIGIMYGCNLFFSWMFADHISLGCMTLSLFSPRKALVLLSYFPVYLLMFLSISVYRTRSLHLLRNRRSEYAFAILLACIGEVLLLCINYIPFLFTGQPGLYEGRFAIGMIMYILPILPVFGIIDVYTYHRTGTVWLGAFLNTMLFSWAFLATNALELMW